jgi:hypothetical protein
MTSVKTFTAVSLALGLSMPVLAEEAHHSGAGTAPVPQIAQAPQTTPPAARPMQPGMGHGQGMGMGQGGQMGGAQGMGMMGQGGPMGAGPGMDMTGQSGMSGMMPMMGMMQMMQGGQHIEGRLAFAKAELRITGAQETAWSNFANALRHASAKAYEPMSGMADSATPVQLIEQHEKQLVARLEAIRIVKPALEQLYASLDDGQRKTLAQIHMIFLGVI